VMTLTQRIGTIHAGRACLAGSGEDHDDRPKPEYQAEGCKDKIRGRVIVSCRLARLPGAADVLPRRESCELEY
jgi:hypothetical protein